MNILQEERHTSKGLSFNVDLGNENRLSQEPQIKKRLEQEAAAEPPHITLQQIREKLERAEEKRRQNLNSNNHNLDDRIEAVR